jgi:hypothetical protein
MPSPSPFSAFAIPQSLGNQAASVLTNFRLERAAATDWPHLEYRLRWLSLLNRFSSARTVSPSCRIFQRIALCQQSSSKARKDWAENSDSTGSSNLGFR